jgi:hypothetical protein
MNQPCQALAAILENCDPKALVAVGALGNRLAAHWRAQHGDCQITCVAAEDVHSVLKLDQTQDLALVTDSLEHLSRRQGQLLLGQLRNYGTRQIAVLVDDASGWTLTDFLGLGFRRQARFDQGDQALSLYTYNIDSYNHRREWNNPRFWANPEMWGKSWW